MRLLVFFAAAVCAIAVVIIGAVWTLISALAFYILVAIAAYITWRIAHNEEFRARSHERQARRNRILNDQEYAAWRKLVDDGRKSELKRRAALDRIDRQTRP